MSDMYIRFNTMAGLGPRWILRTRLPRHSPRVRRALAHFLSSIYGIL